MITFKEFFGSKLTEQSTSFSINVVGTEDGESKNYTISIEANSEAEAKDKAKDKVAEMIANNSLPSDASIQNLEEG
jgi:hypothetical protein